MIVVQLVGGLGNQLFQYAMGKRISHVNDLPLKLDLSWFRNNLEYPYSLNHFSINESFASPKDCKYLTKSRILYKIINNLKEHNKPYYQRSYIIEKSVDFDPNILLVCQSTYLSGYWQSEKYFKDIETILRKDFVVTDQMDEVNKIFAQKILSSNSVAVHVRRGDYISNSKANEVHGTCSIGYYNKAIDFITSKIKNPHFFFFSDDPEWTKNNLKIDFQSTYLSHNGPNKNYEDLRLMSLCNHFIIANSSFSWWGAWLSSNKNKIVIAPSKWFQNLEYNDSDRLPLEWIRI